MRFQFIPVKSLPRLAWCARVRKAQDVVDVYHGPWVETRGNWFIEGAWDGPFAEGRFDEAHTLAGSGGRVTESEVVFASPSFLIERIQSVRVADELLVSNSIPFLLAVSDDEPDPLYRFYRDDLSDFLRVGTRRAHKPLRTRRGRCLLLHDMANLSIRPDLSIRRIEKQVPSPPVDFAGYVALLQAGMEGILRNAADPERAHQRYRPLATLSQGYDSPALAVLVKSLGGTEAMTFRRQNPRHAPKNDSGLDIGRYLGFDVTEYDALQFRELPGSPEAEFFACPDGADVVMAPVEAQLAGTVFITGRHGDSVLSLQRRRILSDLRQAVPTLAGMTMNEFRLRVGFVQYVPLFTAAQHIHAIHDISAAPEMKPWSIGGLYDRPIARRIVEEAGIPREWFGWRKMASAHHIIDRMESMSREGQADFARYLHTLPPIPPPRRVTDAARIAAITTRAKWGDALNRHVRWLPEFLADLVYGMPCRTSSHTCFDFGFHWGYARVRSRYTVFRSGE